MRHPADPVAVRPSLRRVRLWTVFLTLFTVAVVAADLATDRQYWMGIMLLLAPAAAAVELSPARTAVFGMLAVTFLTGLYGFDPGPWPPMDSWITIATVAVAAAGCVAASYRREDRWLELARSRFTVRVLQQTLLEELPVTTDEVDVAGFYRAAEAETNVGGDLYEIVPSAYGTRVLIADVQGKGLAAVQLGAAVITAFRESAYHQSDPLVVLQRLEQAIARHRARIRAREDARDERFVTALLLDFAADGRVRFLHCGHPLPVVVSTHDTRKVCCAKPGLPLGLLDLDGDPRPLHDVSLRPGERLLLCTDGVVEARNASGAFYPLARRLRRWAALPSPDLVHDLAVDLDVYAAGHAPDDQAALLVTPRTG
ncbi:PP2C family protein-serine/threonine phosphatase [Streptomyces sp. NPDC051940]|uniref:PP2C family protein-serine/threonine phosphatase n=1 Tax=Streptomyces sp. NPDC051940 TaxID=3155675 RepID=UPI003415218D